MILFCPAKIKVVPVGDQRPLPPSLRRFPLRREIQGGPAPRELPEVLFISQDFLQSLRLAQRACVLENSRIVMEGKGSDLLQDPKVKEAYLGI